MNPAYFPTEFGFKEFMLAQLGEVGSLIWLELEHFTEKVADYLLLHSGADVTVEVDFHESRGIGYLFMEKAAVLGLKDDVGDVFINDGVAEKGD